jgi:hypothetical protein
MDLIARFWSDIGTLKLVSAWLQWISISLVFVSGFLQVGKFVDRQEKVLIFEVSPNFPDLNSLMSSAWAGLNIWQYS